MSEFRVPCPPHCTIPHYHHHLAKPVVVAGPDWTPSKGDIVRIGQGALLWKVHYVGTFISMDAVDEDGNYLNPARSNSVKANRLTLVKAAPPPPPRREISQGCVAIYTERQRQWVVLGYTPEHDLVEHESESGISEIMVAAMCYVTAAFQRAGGFEVQAPAWPPGMGEFKSKSIDEDLIRAGALIAAELDRRAAVQP